MFKHLLETKRRTTLLTDAIAETLNMIERAERMFGVVCHTLLNEQQTAVDIKKEDRDINSGERMVRRLVLEHLALNPKQDLSSSLALISIVHDIERLGDYAKNLIELNRWSDLCADDGLLGTQCKEIHQMIAPLFGQALEALRESDARLARGVMRRHEEIKAHTDRFLESVMQDAADSKEAVLYALSSRYLRRISAHLSNIASSVANPLDKISGKTA